MSFPQLIGFNAGKIEGSGLGGKQREMRWPDFRRVEPWLEQSRGARALCAGRGDRDCFSVVPVGKHGRGHWELSKGLSGHEGWAEGLLIFV